MTKTMRTKWILSLLCILSVAYANAWERVPVWPKGKMPNQQEHQIAAMTDEVKEKQRYVFERQMAIAQKYGLPVIIHDREAHGDCFEMALKYPEVKGIFHSYSGSSEMARELTKRGWYISFSGTLTFTNAARVREAASAVPRDKLLIETDAPYLAPHPNRGQLNHSGYLPLVLSALAQIWDCSPTDAAEQTYQNALAFFNLP